MSHKPGFFEDTLPDLGRTTEDAAVASRIAALEAAMRELDMVAIERLIAPIYIHVDRDGCVMNRDEWLAFVRGQSNRQRAVPKFVSRIETVEGTALVDGYAHGGSDSRQDGDAPGHSGIGLVQVWSIIDGDWRRIYSRSSVRAPTATGR